MGWNLGEFSSGVGDGVPNPQEYDSLGLLDLNDPNHKSILIDTGVKGNIKDRVRSRNQDSGESSEVLLVVSRKMPWL